jgi:hypothetical protein
VASRTGRGGNSWLDRIVGRGSGVLCFEEKLICAMNFFLGMRDCRTTGAASSERRARRAREGSSSEALESPANMCLESRAT